MVTFKSTSKLSFPRYLSMPYAFARVGLIPGISLLFLAAIITWFSLRILITSAISSSYKAQPSHSLYFTPPAAPSYAELARASMRGANMPTLVEILVALSCLGFAVSYLVAIGECMPGLVSAIFPGIENSTGLVSSFAMDTRLWMFGMSFAIQCAPAK